jgi:hypothetical protein
MYIDAFGTSSSNGNGDLIFSTNNGGSNINERVRIKYNGEVCIGGNISTYSNYSSVMTVYGNANITSNLYIFKDLSVFSNVNVSNDIIVGNNVQIYNSVIIASNEIVGKDLMVMGDVSCYRNMSISSNLTTSTNLYVSGDSFFGTGTISAKTSIIGSIDLNTTQSNSAIKIVQNGTGKLLDIFKNSDSKFTIANNGFVGINRSNPDYMLDLNGSARVSSNIKTQSIEIVGNSQRPIDNIIALKSLNPTILDAIDSAVTPIFGGGNGAIYDSNIEAWRFVNDAAGKKIGWYFFGNSNTSNALYKYKNLKTVYYKIRFNGSNVPTDDMIPFISLYSLPTFDGNDGAFWYRHRMNHFNYTDMSIELGKDYVYYIGDNPVNCGFLNLVSEKPIRVHFSSNAYQAYVGPSNETRIQDNDIMEYIVLNTSSSATVNATDFTLTEFGFRFGTQINRFVTCYSSN